MFVELLTTTNFTFLKGASHGPELMQRAAELAIPALGVADEASLAGIVRAYEGAEEHKVKLLTGARFFPVDALGVALYAQDRAGYGRLCRLITLGRRRAEKGSCQLGFEDLATHAQGLIAIALPPGQALYALRGFQQRRAIAERSRWLARYREVFGERIWQAVTRHLHDDDQSILELQLALATQAQLPPVASNDVLYHSRERQALHDALTCIRLGTTLDQAGRALMQNSERCLKGENQMRALFADHEELVERTQEAADACHFSLAKLRYEYPREVCPQGHSPTSYLAEITTQGAHNRYPEGVPPKVQQQIDHELELIAELSYEPYFLTVYDIVNFARAVGILCQGRGSAANSAVCFCLGVTSVDPAHHNLLFERFISKERAEPPDIDIDFEHHRREEVFQYIYEKYGRERAGLTAVVITYRRRSAMREVAKVFGMPLDQIDSLVKHVDTLSDPELITTRLREAGLSPKNPVLWQIIALARQLRGFPRHLSQHVGGFVIARDRLDELVPIENAAMEGRTVIEWDKDDIDTLGILKVDCLALGMLTAIARAFDLLRQREGNEHTLASVLATDTPDPDQPEEPGPFAKPVYDMLCEGDSIGVFQVESRAQMQMLPRLKPRCFYDLVVEVSIVRPGPIQGGMVHPYLRRRHGEEPITYPAECTRPVLEKTLGVPLFQEQAMRLAMVAAGYSPGEADQLRKDMAAWRRNGKLERHRGRLLEGMAARGIGPEFAEQLYQQLLGFSGYGFPESHAASFALLVYVSSWLKRYHPAVFTASLINAQPMGFYSNASLVRDAREHGVLVLPPDVNLSSYDCTLEGIVEGLPGDDPDTWGRGGPALRLGFRCIKGMAQESCEKIADARRKGGFFRSVEDFAQRTKIGRKQLVKLAEADAFSSLAINRRQALWQVKAWQELPPLFRTLEMQEAPATLPSLSLDDHVFADYAAYALSLRSHPVALVRDQLQEMGAQPASRLRQASEGESLTIGGLVTCRQRPGTASGVVFMTMEDESGIANVVIWAKTFERYRQIVRLQRALCVRGHVQFDASGKVVNLIADHFAPFPETPTPLLTRSRDFH